MSTPTEITPGQPQGSTRLMSIDALRGFDMFWIVGAEGLVKAFDRMSGNSVTRLLASQLSHKEWAGFAFYDLIFPLFVFIAGVSSVFSLRKETALHGRMGATRRLLRRGLLLLLLGVFYSGGFANDWPNIRLLGVLQRIGLASLGAGLCYIWMGRKTLISTTLSILVGYWALLTFVPIRDLRLNHGTLDALAAAAGTTNSITFARSTFDSTTTSTHGRFDPGYNLCNHLDFQFLPGRLYDTYYDPEGLLSTLPAIGSCLLGLLAGLLLTSPNYCNRWKLIYLYSFGLAAVLLGFLWGTQFPVVKKIWSSSFVLVAGGYSAMLLATFYGIVDCLQWRRWCQPFVWIGTNSITIYLANNLLGFRRVAERLAGGDVRRFLDTHVTKGFGELVVALTAIGIGIAIVRFLHRRQLFLRV